MIVVEGMEEVIASLKELPTVIDRRRVFSDVASQMKQRLTSVTPLGYSGKLKRSVVSEVDEEQAVVGYEEGVETAGNPRLDSVIRPRTKGRSVLWVHVQDLEEMAKQEFDDFSEVAVSVMESGFLEQIDARS